MAKQFCVLLLLTATAAGLTLAVRAVAPGNSAAQTDEQTQQPTLNSVARYASKEFFAGCRLRTKALHDHAYAGLLPIHLLPQPLSLGRLQRLQVEELAVFCGPAADRRPNDPQQLEWAVAAQLAQPVELSTVITLWHQSIVPNADSADVTPVELQIESTTCFRVPAGTFLPPPRTYGQLRFYDRNGELRWEGVNVGRVYDHRGYIEGETQASAVFTLDEIKESDIVDEHLPLELRLDVFLTYYLKREYSTAQIQLRNQVTGLTSHPITFEPKSYANHLLLVPRRLTAIDGDDEKQVDLLNDLVVSGRLEVILKGREMGVYLGVGPEDLNVRPNAFEYVFVSDRDIVVAQSPQTLANMLQAAAAPAPLASRLNETTADLAIVASIQDASQRNAFRHLVSMISQSEESQLWADELRDLSATVLLPEPESAQVTARFGGNQSADRAQQHVSHWLRSLKRMAHNDLDLALKRQDTLNNMISLGMNGVQLQYPNNDRLIAETRLLQALAVIYDPLDNIQLETQDDALHLKFTRPKHMLNLPHDARTTLASLEELMARDLAQREQFERGDEVFQRVTDRLPDYPQSWFRRAHQLAYNTSVEFDGNAARYAWVRRGIHVLLDGVEKNPKSTDLLWMTARFLGWKVGDVDERDAYRQLFSQDERLHARLAKLVDLQQARSPDKQIDNWLVAKQLSERCVERHPTSPPEVIPPLVFFAQPATAQARYARALTEAGHVNDAQPAWRLAQQMFNELGDLTITVGEADRVRLNDWDTLRNTLPENDASLKLLKGARMYAEFDYWLARCQLEQTELLQRCHRLTREAAEHARNDQPQQAIAAYEQALFFVAELQQQHPELFAQIVGDFGKLVKDYRLAVDPQREPDPRLADILTLIDDSTSRPQFPYLKYLHELHGDEQRFPWMLDK